MKPHSSHQPSNSNFHLDFDFEPLHAKGADRVKLLFRPLESGNHKEVVLESVHDKDMHLLIVSDDLSYFRHEHPHLEAGGYVHEHKFPNGGNYVLFVDYAPHGSSQQVSRHEIEISGKTMKPEILPDQQTEWNEHGYRLYISEEQAFPKAHTLVELSLQLEKEGQPVKDLDSYLGALAHVVIISEDTKEYLHVHPMETKENGPEIKLHTSFPNSGKYKMFVQFSHQGKILTASFILVVK